MKYRSAILTENHGVPRSGTRSLDSATVTSCFYQKLGTEGLQKLATSQMTKSHLALLHPFLSHEDKILDLGCGYGRVTIPLAQAGYHIEGIDIAPDLVRTADHEAKRNGITLSFRVGDMRCLPYENERFTKILNLWSCFDDLLSREDQLCALRESLRVLKPGGMALFELLNGEATKFRTLVQENGFGPDGRLWRECIQGVENISYHHDRSTLRSLCEEVGPSQYIVGFKNIAGRRRLVMILTK